MARWHCPRWCRRFPGLGALGPTEAEAGSTPFPASSYSRRPRLLVLGVQHFILHHHIRFQDPAGGWQDNLES